MINKDNKYWKSKLDELSYKVLREAATEIPFSGKYNLHFKNGNSGVKDVMQFYLKAIQSLIAGVAGQVLTEQKKAV